MKNKKYTAMIFTAIVSVLIIAGAMPAEHLLSAQLTSAFTMGSPNFQYAVTMDYQQFTRPAVGSRYGSIRCKEIELEVPLYYGDSEEILEKGAGQYSLSGMPGEGRSILIGAHDMTFFKPLEKIKKNQVIEIETTYGLYKYKVKDIKVLKAADPDLYQQEEKESLILYTCYPFGLILGDRSRRFVVYCDKISGREVQEAL
ncbi:Sortase (surface protein transpeptidase) [uncultured Eubacterium sp.]|nr:Sortase (surface protein transpeptidase) [uncultured Eubacterium sp.]